MATRIVISMLGQIRARMNRVRERELAAASKRLPDLTPAQRVAVERLSRALMTAFLRTPSARLRDVATRGDGSDVVAAARYLFALDERHENRERIASDDVRAA